jgi:competence ComEA-like helix-hairpin-helix protein
VNINLATVEELSMVSGIGWGGAVRIVGHRERHGPFGDAAQLADVDQFGEARVRHVIPLVTVNSVVTEVKPEPHSAPEPGEPEPAAEPPATVPKPAAKAKSAARPRTATKAKPKPRAKAKPAAKPRPAAKPQPAESGPEPAAKTGA